MAPLRVGLLALVALLHPASLAMADELPARPRFAVEGAAGHADLGSGGGGLNAVGVRALVMFDSGLCGQLATTGLRLDGKNGAFAAAMIGYRTRKRLWVRGAGGVGFVWYKRVDLLQGGTQSGEPRAPRDSLIGLAGQGALGFDLVREASWRLYTGGSLDVLFPGALIEASAFIGMAWR